MKEQLLIYFIIIPLVGLVLTSLFRNKQEKYIFGITMATIVIHSFSFITFTIVWLINGNQVIFNEVLQLYQADDSHFSISLFFDKLTVFYGIITGIITFLVAVFSRYYMHREKGFKRFFGNILFFYLGIHIVILAGNFETLFVGWETIGIASFLLIAFYRDRYLPVKNALKVVSYYRLADIFLLIGIWLCHHFFRHSITFIELHELSNQGIKIISHQTFGIFIPLIFLIVALVKSAQFPFSTWLPRAMEGPTTSSAIFYGSLAVHMGVFLLLRTYPLWETNWIFKGIVIFFGAITILITAGIAKVQSTVKTQIAYASLAQIGLMFIEVALGWHWLALIHFAGNAFLRTYQLLVSPSVLSYRIHDQFFNFILPQHNTTKLNLTLYSLNLKEWNLDKIMYEYLWLPLKKIGYRLNFIGIRIALFIFVPLYGFGLYLAYNQDIISSTILSILPLAFAILGLLMILKAFVERKNALYAWFFIILNQSFTSLSIAFNEQFSFEQVYLYLSGIIASGLVGFFCLRNLKKAGKSIEIDTFHGYSSFKPTLSLVFLVACMGLSGFPITPTFIGEDLLLGHISENQYLLLGLTTMSLILDGLAIFRIYARIFLGPNHEVNHEVAYRSS